jgi:hypothetical protein
LTLWNEFKENDTLEIEQSEEHCFHLRFWHESPPSWVVGMSAVCTDSTAPWFNSTDYIHAHTHKHFYKKLLVNWLEASEHTSTRRCFCLSVSSRGTIKFVSLFLCLNFAAQPTHPVHFFQQPILLLHICNKNYSSENTRKQRQNRMKIAECFFLHKTKLYQLHGLESFFRSQQSLGQSRKSPYPPFMEPECSLLCRKSPPLVPTLSPVNPDHTFLPYFLRSIRYVFLLLTNAYDSFLQVSDKNFQFIWIVCT